MKLQGRMLQSSTTSLRKGFGGVRSQRQQLFSEQDLPAPQHLTKSYVYLAVEEHLGWDLKSQF